MKISFRHDIFTLYDKNLSIQKITRPYCLSTLHNTGLRRQFQALLVYKITQSNGKMSRAYDPRIRWSHKSPSLEWRFLVVRYPYHRKLSHWQIQRRWFQWRCDHRFASIQEFWSWPKFLIFNLCFSNLFFFWWFFFIFIFWKF